MIPDVLVVPRYSMLEVAAILVLAALPLSDITNLLLGGLEEWLGKEIPKPGGPSGSRSSSGGSSQSSDDE